MDPAGSSGQTKRNSRRTPLPRCCHLHSRWRQGVEWERRMLEVAVGGWGAGREGVRGPGEEKKKGQMAGDWGIRCGLKKKLAALLSGGSG